MDLDASVKEKIVVHAGATIRIIAYVSGKPAPQITWSRDDGEVPKEAKVETTGISNSLVIKNCKRQHQGIYTLCAKNEGGERRKAVIVEVLGELTPTDPASVLVRMDVYEHETLIHVILSLTPCPSRCPRSCRTSLRWRKPHQ